MSNHDAKGMHIWRHSRIRAGNVILDLPNFGLNFSIVAFFVFLF